MMKSQESNFRLSGLRGSIGEIGHLSSSALRKALLISLPSLLLFALLAEVSLRLLVPVSDYPKSYFDAELGRHFLPDQTGRFVKGLPVEIDARFSINSTGWNAPRDYRVEKSPGTFRIAVIGDSFIEALQVDPDRSYPYLLEAELRGRLPGREVEVLTFAHSGASLAQYLAVLRREVVRYNPDLVIVNVVGNDYTESLYPWNRVDFWALERTATGFVDVAPRQAPDLVVRRVASRSALVRFLLLNLSIEAGWRGMPLPWSRRPAGASVGVRADQEMIADMLGHVMVELKRLVEGELSGQLLLVLDSDHGAIYQDADLVDSQEGRNHLEALAATQRVGIPVVDLLPPLRAEWKRSGERFEWRTDGHWNQSTHSFIAELIGRRLIELSDHGSL